MRVYCHSGKAMAVLGTLMLPRIMKSGVEFDCPFGPAQGYSGGYCCGFCNQHGLDVPWGYNRK
jgi:hypothetical protein